MGSPTNVEGTLNSVLKKSFVRAGDLAQIVLELLGVVMVVAGHAEGIEAKTLRGVQRTIQMIGLGGHHDALGAEHVLRTIHALVRGEACMVAEDVRSLGTPWEMA